jgi:hypothetical protein
LGRNESIALADDWAGLAGKTVTLVMALLIAAGSAHHITDDEHVTPMHNRHSLYPHYTHLWKGVLGCDELSSSLELRRS